MGFGGGGSGSFVLPDHDHTNALADGGELLEATSLIDGATLQAWWTAEYAAALLSQKYTLIEDYTAGGAITSKTFTIAEDFADISQLVLVYNFTSTAALTAQFKINALAGTLNNTQGARIGMGTTTYINLSAAAQCQLASATIMGAVNQGGRGVLNIGYQPVAPYYGFEANNHFASNVGYGQELTTTHTTSSSSAITSLQVYASASTFKAGARMTLYKVERA